MTTIVQVKQKLDDHIEQQRLDIAEIKSILNQIFDQTKKTNGRVTTLEANEINCPAKKEVQILIKQKEESWKKTAVIASIIGLLFTAANFFLIHLK